MLVELCILWNCQLTMTARLVVQHSTAMPLLSIGPTSGHQVGFVGIQLLSTCRAYRSYRGASTISSSLSQISRHPALQLHIRNQWQCNPQGEFHLQSFHRKRAHSDQHWPLCQNLFWESRKSFHSGLWTLVWPELDTCHLRGTWHYFLDPLLLNAGGNTRVCTVHEEGMFWSCSLSGLHLANPSPSINLHPADFLCHVEQFKGVCS